MLDLSKNHLPNAIKINGKWFSIKTDFRVWLQFSKDLNKMRIDENETIDLSYLFKNEVPYINMDAFKAIMDFFTNPNTTPKNDHSSEDERLIDYIEDGEYIYSAFMQLYSIDLVDIEVLHWHKFKALFVGITDKTKYGQILGYRGYEKETRKAEEVYEETKRIWSLPQIRTKKEEQALKEFSDMFTRKE